MSTLNNYRNWDETSRLPISFLGLIQFFHTGLAIAIFLKRFTVVLTGSEIIWAPSKALFLSLLFSRIIPLSGFQCEDSIKGYHFMHHLSPKNIITASKLSISGRSVKFAWSLLKLINYFRHNLIQIGFFSIKEESFERQPSIYPGILIHCNVQTRYAQPLGHG